MITLQPGDRVHLNKGRFQVRRPGIGGCYNVPQSEVKLPDDLTICNCTLVYPTSRSEPMADVHSIRHHNRELQNLRRGR